jgi:hypothetical protein
VTLPLLPREWSSDTNYSSGAVPNTPTKVDPGAALALQGFVPGLPTAAQHFNSILNVHSRAARRAVTLQALHTKPLVTGMSADTTMASVPLGTAFGSSVLVLKSGANNVKRVSDSGPTEAQGAVTSITSVIHAANSGSRIVAIGSGGNFNCFSTNGGVSWTAGGTTGVQPVDIVWNPTHSRFVLVSATTAARFSADAVAWSNSTASLDSLNSGLALLANGNIVACGLDSTAGVGPRFSISSNGATSWADASGTVDDPGGYTSEGGWIAGNGGSVVWHVGRRASNATLRVSVSSDGSAWTTQADLTPGGGITFALRPRILCCPTSGLLVIIGPVSALGQALAYASLDGGATWTDPITTFPQNIAGYALAGGRLFATVGQDVFASDGIGWV